MSAPFVVGIDLGTTHTAIAQCLVEQGAVENSSPLQLEPVSQLSGPSRLESLPLLPSFLYFAADGEQALALPWDDSRDFAVGSWARDHGASTPGRVISSAKSWLSHSGVDRRAELLPPHGAPDIEKISPVEASFRYLDHLAESWSQDHEEALGDQEVILTVPASFDAGARDLTVEAAYAAGFENVFLLEEPQAALYAWLEASGDAWREHLKVGDVILVIDIGGGTTDFSAISVQDNDGDLGFSRIAVGDHILLGGDNIDLALAHTIKQKLTGFRHCVDNAALQSLTHACRAAKERLLSENRPEQVPVALAQRGAKLLGGVVQTDLRAEEVDNLVLNGFFPEVTLDDRPRSRARGALTQIGLPYASDPAISKHLVQFLHQHGPDGQALTPTRVLFNGGVLKSTAIRERLLQMLGGWFPTTTISELPSTDLDGAVARGACYYGQVRRGRGIRIRGGTGRAYYVGVESPAPAIPGIEPPVSALCVAPLGMEEGSEVALPDTELGLIVGEAVQFRFFSSTTRTEPAGTLHESVDSTDLVELAPIEITLTADGRSEGDVVAIHLEASITAVGTLLLEAVPTTPLQPDERWKIELSVRG
ncbi:MAG: Hsp70 family protein [Polyangiaceae bacterium]|nr:Hsp70 family protein [Polyangiaceae bacterium]